MKQVPSSPLPEDLPATFATQVRPATPPMSAILEDIFPNRTGEHSDDARLRSQHVTAGYRDGIASAKGLHVQTGFDEGYPLGAVMGYYSLLLIGILEGLANAGVAGVADVLSEAKKELTIEGLISQEWFDEDGVWRYEADGEGFEDVARMHPVILRWQGRVKELVGQAGMKMGVLDTEVSEGQEIEVTG